jgi:hypothetical protein
MSGMIDPAGMVRIFRVSPEQVWHVVERGDQHLVAPCGMAHAADAADERTIPVDSLLTAGRICLDCAQVLISAG